MMNSLCSSALMMNKNVWFSNTVDLVQYPQARVNTPSLGTPLTCMPSHLQYQANLVNTLVHLSLVPRQD